MFLSPKTTVPLNSLSNPRLIKARKTDIDKINIMQIKYLKKKKKKTLARFVKFMGYLSQNEWTRSQFNIIHSFNS